MKEIALTLRSLRKSPAFALTAVLIIGLGIGATAAIFSVMNGVLLRPLPYRDPGRLVVVWSELRTRHLPDFPIAPPDFADMKRSATLFEDMAGLATVRGVISGDNAEAQTVRLGFATINIFRILGAHIELGRDFIDSDATPAPAQAGGGASGAAPAVPPPPSMVILSHEFWERRYGRDPNVIGRGFDLFGGKAQIVGVLAPGFELLFKPSAGLDARPDFWSAARIDYKNASRNNVIFRVIGRLKPGATVAQAQGQLGGIAAYLRENFPIKKTSGLDFTVTPMRDELVSGVRPAIMALMGAVIFLLLIACSNVGNLMLVRLASRDRELAVRAALGGNRWRLVRQLLDESLALSLAGGLLGLLLARLGLDLLVALGPRNLPRLDEVSLDPMVLAFTAACIVLTAGLFGVVPALRASRPDIADVLRASGRTTGLGSGALLRNAVVVVEVGLCFVLLAGSGLMVRSFLALQRVDPGYDPRGVLTFLLPLNGARTEGQRAAMMRDLRDRFRALPGVSAVTAASTFPLDGNLINCRYGREDAVTDASRFRQANVHVVLPGYFEALRTPILEGRGFTEADNDPKQSVVIIDQLLASKAFPHEPAVGKRLFMRFRGAEAEWMQIIGVAAHEHHEGLAEDTREAVFLTDGFMRHGFAGTWALRTQGDPMRLAPLVHEEIGKVSKALALDDVMPMQTLVDRASGQTRFALVLIGIFAGIAAVLAAVGLYGVLSSAVRQRTAEIGVRVALGARPAEIFGLMARQGLRLSAMGIALGIGAALALTRVMSSMLVGVRPTDPLTFGAMAVVFLAIALCASCLPARRAAALDPVRALREE
jgi:putative ABC transport system permease protein